MPQPQIKLKPVRPIINWGDPLTKGLVFDAPFSEGAGLKAWDSFSKKEGSLTNGPTWIKNFYGPAISFDGSDDIVGFTGIAPQNSLAQISIEALFQPRGVGGGGSDQRLIHKGDGTGTKRFAFGTDNAGTSLEFQAGWSTTDGDWLVSGLSLNTWYHAILTYSFSSTANTPTFYLNSVNKAITTTGSSPSGSANADGTEISLGNRTSDKLRQFNGYKAYFRYWNRIITPIEVSMLFSNPWRIYVKSNFTPYYIPSPAVGGVTVKTLAALGVG